MSFLLAQAKAAVAIPFTLLKNANLSPLAEIVVYEVAYAEALLAAHRAVAAQAITEAVAVVQRRHDRPIDDGLIERVATAVAAVYDRLFEDWTRPIAQRLDRKILLTSKDVTWRRAMGAISAPLVYEFRDVQKTEPPPWRDVPTPQDPSDEDSIAGSARYHAFWIGSFYERLLADSIQRQLQASLATHPTGVEAAYQIRQVLRRDLGLTEEPPQVAWSGGTPRNYFIMTAAEATTTTRALGALSALANAGIRYAIWRTAGDDRVCPRCSAMDGRQVPLRLAQQQLQGKLAARTEANLEAVAPWLDEDEFLAAVDRADSTDSPAETLAQSGIVGPPAHGRCRCALDVDTGIVPTFGPDTDPIHADLRQIVAQRVLGALPDLTVPQRRAAYETVGSLTPWLNQLAVALLVSEAIGLVADHVGAVAVGSRLHVTHDALDTAAVGEYNSTAFALGVLANRQLAIGPQILALFSNARSKHLLLHPSAVTPELYFAQGFEAYLEVAPSDNRDDRQRLAAIDPPLHTLIDRIVQDRVILSVAEVLGLVTTSVPREQRQLTRAEEAAVQVLSDMTNAIQAEWPSLQDRMVEVLAELPESERQYYANALAALAASKGWVSL